MKAALIAALACLPSLAAAGSIASINWANEPLALLAGTASPAVPKTPPGRPVAAKPAKPAQPAAPKAPATVEDKINALARIMEASVDTLEYTSKHSGEVALRSETIHVKSYYMDWNDNHEYVNFVRYTPLLSAKKLAESEFSFLEFPEAYLVVYGPLIPEGAASYADIKDTDAVVKNPEVAEAAKRALALQAADAIKKARNK